MVPTFDRETRQVTPIIEEMFLGVARRLRPRLATFTGLDTPVAVKGVRPVALSQFLEGDTWADASVWATYGQEDGDELVVVALDGRLVARMMGPLMGQGAADEVADDEVLRPITPVELRVGTRLTRFLVDAFESSWSVGVPPRLRLVDAAPSRRVCGDLDDSASYAVCTVEFTLGGMGAGSAHVALPTGLVRRLLPRAQGGAGAADRPAPKKSAPRAAQFDRVMPVEVEISVELARVNVLLKRLEGLRVGDEILIGAAGEAIARIGDLAVFAGEPGASGTVRSVRVINRMISDLSSEMIDR